jgi:hypothetical protein
MDMSKEDTSSIIQKLLSLRLTKFQFGFCSGLKGHKPSKEQAETLARILARYENVWAYIKPDQTNHTERPDRYGRHNEQLATAR